MRFNMHPMPERVLLFGAMHVIVTLCLVGYANYGSSLRFDGFQPPRGWAAAGTASQILMMPGYLLWTTSASKNLPGALEWLLFLANSALWGLAASAVVGFSFTRRD